MSKPSGSCHTVACLGSFKEGLVIGILSCTTLVESHLGRWVARAASQQRKAMTKGDWNSKLICAGEREVALHHRIAFSAYIQDRRSFVKARDHNTHTENAAWAPSFSFVQLRSAIYYIQSRSKASLHWLGPRAVKALHAPQLPRGQPNGLLVGNAAANQGPGHTAGCQNLGGCLLARVKAGMVA